MKQSKEANAGSLHADGSVWQPAAHYKREPGTWWKGRRVKLQRQLRTVGGDVYRKGRIVKVARKYRGLTLVGRNLHITRVGLHGLSVDATPNDKVSDGGPLIDVGQPERGVAVASSDLLCRPVAILYARSDSIYKTLEGCDVWDATRDARNFPGGMPVVAHPPCRAWSALAHLAKPRPDEKDLARHAVKVVRECGGVLEHPISSRLWADQKLPQPGERDAWGGYTLIMPQWWFGHLAEKGTRFYIVGVAMKDLPEVKLKLGDAPCVVTTSKRKCQTPPAEWRERLGNREKEGTPPDACKSADPKNRVAQLAGSNRSLPTPSA